MSKIWDIVKKVGTGIVADVVPGGNAILSFVNGFLDDDNKLPVNATGSDIQNAISRMSPENAAAVLAKEFDVQIAMIKEPHETLRTMLAADGTMKHTTRPKIALHSFYVYSFVSVCFSLALLYGAIVSDEPLKELKDLWLPIGTVLAPIVILLKAYFGILADEKKATLNAIK